MPKLKSQEFSSYIPESAGLRSFATRQTQDTPPRSWPDVDIKDFLEPAWKTLKNTPRDLIEKIPPFPSESIKQNFSGVSSSVHDSFSKIGSSFAECFKCHSKTDIEEGETKQKTSSNMKRAEWWNSCFCLRGTEAPKIEHILADSPTLVPIQPMSTLPEWEKMEPEELQSRVLELLDELDLTTSQKNGILNFPLEKQLQLLYSHSVQSTSQKVDRPEAYIAKLDEYTALKEPSDEYQLTTWLKYTNGLKTALATHSNTFIGEFVEAGGLASLLGFLEAMDDQAKEGQMHTNLVACIKALMNNSNGRKHILAHPTCLSVITQSLVTSNVKTQTMVLEILGGVCLLPGGHKKILEAMLHYQRFAGERTRFQTLVNMLDQYRGNYIELVTLKIAIMSFINAVIRWGPGEESLEFRLHLRYEFLMLGLQPILDKLRSLENDILDTHLDAFEFYRAEDEREWARRFEELHVDTKSASAMFKLLQSRLQYSSAYPHFLSLMHHLLLLMPGDLTSPDRWLLFDRILQQLVTQDADGSDKEVSVVDINVKEIVQLLASEQELRDNRQKIARLEADNADAVTELNTREQKIYQLTQEKEVAEGALQQMLTQVEAETIRSQTLESQKAQLEMQILQLTEQINEMAKGGSPNKIVNVKSFSPTSPGTKGLPSPILPPPPPPVPSSMPPIAPAPPPCPPMMNGIGPPPPPPMQMPSKPTKKIPKSTTQLRALNWSKLPEARVAGTVFAALDESSLYKALDLEDIDKTFDSSASKKGISDGEKTLERMRTMKSTNFTVLEGRRQQNCAILLSKLKLSNEELIRVLLNMDVDHRLAPDMVEQLLKFTPTPEEKSMLEEHADEIAMYSTADRFLFEISKLNHYEQRLTCLLYQKKYKERVGECEPKILALFAASKEVLNSKRLKRLLELVLAFGNYMNKGQRGGAFGFRISSLNKLADVRATTDRSLTLLHYIIKVCTQQWPDLLNLPKDLTSVHEGAKVNLTELQKDMSSLEEGLTFLDKEVTWHRSQGGAAPGDRFRLVMTEFSGVASEKLSALQSQFKDMKTQLNKVMKMFGEDPNTQQPEDFFGYFDTFIDSFKDAQKDLEASKRKEEEEERKKKEMEDRERRVKERKQQRMASNTANSQSNGGNSSKSGTPGEQGNDFDELISALRSGDVFGKDIDKMRRKKRHSIGTRNPDRDRV